MKKYGWRRPLLMSGLWLGAEKVVEEMGRDGDGALAVAAGVGAIAADVAGHFLIHVAHGEREEAESREQIERNHHVRRGMAAALRRSLTRVSKQEGGLYQYLFREWDEKLGAAETEDIVLDRVFPVEQFCGIVMEGD